MRRQQWLVTVLALLTGAGFAWVSWGGDSVGASCVWGGGSDVTQTDRFLRGWIVDAKGPALRDWNANLEGNRVQLDLSTEDGGYQIAISLGATCWTAPSVRLVSANHGAGAFPTARDLRSLAQGFPAPKVQLGATSRVGRAIAAVFLVAACVGLGIAASAAPFDRSPVAMARNGVWVLLLIGLAAWPVLFVPFDTDAPALRAAFAAVDPFGDWNHPFLPYVFNRPTTWFSLEPWALRLVPLAFLCVETGLLMLAATRAGGGVAGALAVVWFACEVRRRHGLVDLSDWDVAGTFLMALLLVVQRREWIGWGAAALIGGFMAAGVMSSWLMIVVCGVLVGCLGIEALRGRCQPACAALVAIVFAVLAKVSLGVFALGKEQPPMVSLDQLWHDMYVETPLGRTLAMSIPIALGIAWLARRSRRVAACRTGNNEATRRHVLSPVEGGAVPPNRRRPQVLETRFVALCLIAVPAALSVANERSHVNGGYYVGIVTPLLLYAASVGTAEALEALVSAVGSYGTVAVRSVLVLAIAVATAGRLGTGEAGIGAEHLQILAHESRGNTLPIFTNSEDLPRLLAYERARAGEGAMADVIAWGPPDLQGRVRLLAGDVCAPAAGSEAAGFYVAYLDSADRHARRVRVERLGARCRDLGPMQTVGQRTNWILLCDAPPQVPPG